MIDRGAPTSTRLAIPALAIGAFGIGVTEFSPMAVLPVIAGGLHIPIAKAGLLVSAYAIGVTIGAPLMTLTTTRMARKHLLLLLMGLFTVGNLLSGLAPGFFSLAAARVITALCHGTFFGAGAIVASKIVPPDKSASAVAAMFMGLTVANIAGVPAAAWAGDLIGWRALFLLTAAFGLLTIGILQFSLPAVGGEATINAGAEVRALGSTSVLLALAVTTLQSAAMFTPLTYIAKMLRDGTHVGTLMVSIVLVLFGIGLTIGNWLGGRFADRHLERTLVVTLVALAVLLVAMTFAMSSPIIMSIVVLAWGVACFAMVPPLQLLVVRSAKNAPNLASSTNIGAFNLGNALGAGIGALILNLGLGIKVLPLGGAALALCALAIVVGRGASVRKGRRPGSPATNAGF